MIRRITRSTAFFVTTTTVICVNTVLIGFETEWNKGGIGWTIVEVFFLTCYTCELLLRVAAEKLRSALRDNWLRFDAMVLAVAYLDICLFSPLMSDEGNAKQMAMVLRVVRLMKLARIVRLLRFFKELWLLVASFISAFKTLTWTFLLLLMVIYIFGILFVKLLGQETEHEEVRELFGTLPSAMFTLFQIMTLEGWPEITRMLWKTDEWFMTVGVLAFIMVTTFAILNTVLAVIVEHTLTEATEQRDDMVKKAQAQLHHAVDRLVDLYNSADSNNDGVLTKLEFVKALTGPETRKLLQGMELGEDFTCLDAEEVGILFDTIDVDDSGELTPQEFVKGILQMRGAAKARGVFELHCDLLKSTRRLQESVTEVREQLRLQQQEVAALNRRRGDDFSALSRRLDSISAKLTSAPRVAAAPEG